MQAIIDSSGNNWKGFPFLFALCTAACGVLWFGEYDVFTLSYGLRLTCFAGVDVQKGRRDAMIWAAKQRSHGQTGASTSEIDTEESPKL